MIVSYRHNFIFIKTHKTGGTSVEMALTPLCGPEDIIAPIALDDERDRMLGGEIVARNFAQFDRSLEEEYQNSVLAGDRPRRRAAMKRIRSHEKGFYCHMPARLIREKIDRDFWNSAVKFTIERHPYEKAVSLAYYRLSNWKRPAADFPQVLNQTLRRNTSIDDFPLYTINGEVIATVAQHAQLLPDLQAILAKIGLPVVQSLPRAKAVQRLDRRPAVEILSEDQKAAIRKTCQRTFETFGYEP